MNRPLLTERPASRPLGLGGGGVAIPPRPSARLPSGHHPAGLPEIMGQNPAADPAAEPALAPIATEFQPEPSSQQADPAFHARAPAIPRPEPPGFGFRRRFPHVRDREPLHPRRPRRFPVRRR